MLMLIVLATLLTTGCASTRKAEIATELARSSTAAAEYRDTLEKEEMSIATTMRSEQKEELTRYAITTEGVAAESAMLTAPIQSLHNLPEGAGYAAREGRAGIEVRRRGDNIEVTGHCDSINRLCLQYQEMSMEQIYRADSLELELLWLKEENRVQTSELNSLQAERAKAREKPPARGHWWALAGFAAGLMCSWPARKLKNRIRTLLKR